MDEKDLKASEERFSGNAIKEYVSVPTIHWVPLQELVSIAAWNQLSMLMVTMGSVFLGAFIGLMANGNEATAFVVVIPTIILMSFGLYCNLVFVHGKMRTLKDECIRGTAIPSEELKN